MSELMDAVKLLEDAMDKRANLDTLIERLENELFRLIQVRRKTTQLTLGKRQHPVASPTRKIGRPKGSKDKRPRKKVSLSFFDMTPEQRSEKYQEWGRKGKAVAMANRAAKQNGNAVAAE